MVVPSTASKREQTLRLIEEKDKIEQKIADYGKILEANNVGMTGSLIDDEGFPRNDIDVYQVRQARHQIICLQNDLKELLKRIEIGLQEVHEEAKKEGTYSSSSGSKKFSTENTESGSSSQSTEESSEAIKLLPFVKVNLVSPGSPAEDAGLREGDEIVEFGSVNSKNFNNLSTIADVVRHKENQRIPLKVKRDGQTNELILIPRSWNGRGLLGCNIILTDSVER